VARAQPASYQKLFEDPVFFPHRREHDRILLVAGQSQIPPGAVPLRLFVHERVWIRGSASFSHSLGGAVDPDHLSIRFMLTRVGVINSLIFRLTQMDGPNWLNDPALGLSMAMVVHIWKALPVWTLILMAGRLAIPK